jgi:hypothetical protein
MALCGFSSLTLIAQNINKHSQAYEAGRWTGRIIMVLVPAIVLFVLLFRSVKEKNKAVK